MSLQRIKILLVSIGLGVGGTEEHIRQLATRLSLEEFDIVVVGLKGDGQIAEEIRQAGVRVVTLGGRGVADIRVLLRLWAVVRQESPDIVQGFLFLANMATRLIGKALRVPVIISTYHDTGPSSQLGRWLDRLTMRWATSLACCSEAVEEQIQMELGGARERYHTIPFGVDTVLFQPRPTLHRHEIGVRTDGFVIGTVCRLEEPKKGLRILLEAIAALRREPHCPFFQVIIVGDGPSRVDLEQLSGRLGISELVLFLGMRRDIHCILPLLSLFVLPSLYEGFGIAIIEAMSAGRPVVTTAIPAVRDVVCDGITGVLVPPADPIALAKAIADLLNAPQKASGMGANGRQRVEERYSIQMVVSQHAQYYQALMKQAMAAA